MTQKSLDYGARYVCEQTWQQLLKAFARTVDYVGVKEAAFELDTNRSQLSHALAERNRHSVKAEWVPYLIQAAPDHEAVQILADLRGLEVQPKKTMTPEEELAEVYRALGELAPGLRQMVKERVGR